jgi:hypothetical protein
MSPGQLGILAAMHTAANKGTATPADTGPAPDEVGTNADLVMLSTMTRA